jgi:hypothetical protein
MRRILGDGLAGIMAYFTKGLGNALRSVRHFGFSFFLWVIYSFPFKKYFNFLQ